MIYFAKLDDNNLIIGGLVVSDADCNNGDEATGITFLTNLTGWSKWKKYDPAVDKWEIGGTYDPNTSEFKTKQPSENHIWDSTYKIWRDPAEADLVPSAPTP